MKHQVFLLAFVLGTVSSSVSCATMSHSTAKDLDWRVATQAWSFNRFTFFEAVDKTASASIQYIEAYPGQRMQPGSDAKMHHSMSEADRALAKAKLKETGVTLVNYGVVNARSEEEWTQIFKFAKDMGIETINTEPGENQLDMIEKLADEYGVNIGIHNHPQPSRYWNPDTVLKALEGRSKRMGACADTGHWVRSGLNAVECLKKLEGRIVSFHFKDLIAEGSKFDDRPWGVGMNNVDAMLGEIKRQGFKGVFSVEYETKWTNNVPEITLCANYFRAVIEDGFAPLMKDDLSDTVMPKELWNMEDGVLAPGGKGDIWTKDTYGNFILDLEFKCAEQTNSGVFVRTASIEKWLHTAIEVQILQERAENARHNMGGIFDCLAPSQDAMKPAGEWNRYVIMAMDNNLYVSLNGVPVTYMDLDLWTEAGKNPDGTKNKFKYAYKDMARRGHIGLQYHGQPVWFRNMKIKAID